MYGYCGYLVCALVDGTRLPVPTYSPNLYRNRGPRASGEETRSLQSPPLYTFAPQPSCRITTTASTSLRLATILPHICYESRHTVAIPDVIHRNVLQHQAVLRRHQENQWLRRAGERRGGEANAPREHPGKHHQNFVFRIKDPQVRPKLAGTSTGTPRSQEDVVGQPANKQHEVDRGARKADRKAHCNDARNSDLEGQEPRTETCPIHVCPQRQIQTNGR